MLYFHNLNTLFFPSPYTVGARRIMIDDPVLFCILLHYLWTARSVVSYVPCLPMHSPFHFNQDVPVSEWCLLVSYCVKVNCRDNPQNQTPMLQLLGQQCIWATWWRIQLTLNLSLYILYLTLLMLLYFTFSNWAHLQEYSDQPPQASRWWIAEFWWNPGAHQFKACAPYM
jgi:hypothetical protein